MVYHQPYAHTYQAPRKRGTKRLVFGILGLVANAIGLVVMPIVAGFIAIVITVIGGADVAELDPAGDTFEATSLSQYTIAVPQSDLETATCEISGQNLLVEPAEQEFTLAERGGVQYYDLYDITPSGTEEVTVACEGAEEVVVSEIRMGGTFIGLGIGVVLPIGLGLLALALTIWGAVALIRS